MQDAISKKGNLSASGLDKLTYPILKFEKEDAANLIVSMTDMLLRMQNAWNHGKRAKWSCYPSHMMKMKRANPKIGDPLH
jgi:hypothetical protein